MMRMSGLDEAYISGGASDYDKAEALFAVLPLWSGHPYVNALQEVIARLTGNVYPLTTGSLPDIWQAVARSLAEARLTAADLPRLWGIDRMTCLLTPTQLENLPQHEASDSRISLCLHISHAATDALWGRDVMRRITSQNAQNDVAEGIAAYLDTLAARGCRGVALNLDEEACFVRPNPYTPAQAIVRLQRGERLDDNEKSLVVFQTLRLLGGECLRRGWSLMLFYPQPQVSTAVISYLQACNFLPTLLTVSDTPTVDTLQNGTYVYPLPVCAHEDTVARKLHDLAAKMPIGCLGGLYAPVQGAIDLPLWARAEKVLRGQIRKI